MHTYDGIFIQKVRYWSAQGLVKVRLGFSLWAPPFEYHKKRHCGICILDNCRTGSVPYDHAQGRGVREADLRAC